MKKLQKIVAIPIEKQPEVGDIYKCDAGEGYFLITEKKLNWTKNKGSVYQLLLLSDDEIKENTNTFKEGINGDWYYNSLYQFIANTGDITPYDFKVIASYPQLKTFDGYEEVSSMPIYSNLPTFQLDFISEWCKNPVDEVEVEFETIDDTYDITTSLKLTPYKEVICNIPQHLHNINCDCEECETEENKRILEQAKKKAEINNSIYSAAEEFFPIYESTSEENREFMMQQRRAFEKGACWMKEYVISKIL